MKDSESLPQSPHHQGHRQRLRTRFQKNPEALENYELIELLLGYANPRSDTKPLAKQLLAQHENQLFSLMDTPEENLTGDIHLTDYQLALFKLVRQINIRALAEKLELPNAWTSPQQVIDFVRSLFMATPNERFVVLFLNTKNRLIEYNFMSDGTVDHAAVYPRKIIEKALQLHATALILAHNHPSGISTPSKEDIQLTQRIKKTCEPLDIRILDHLIVGRYSSYSMASEGDL